MPEYNQARLVRLNFSVFLKHVFLWQCSRLSSNSLSSGNLSELNHFKFSLNLLLWADTKVINLGNILNKHKLPIRHQTPRKINLLIVNLYNYWCLKTLISSFIHEWKVILTYTRQWSTSEHQLSDTDKFSSHIGHIVLVFISFDFRINMQDSWWDLSISPYTELKQVAQSAMTAHLIASK